MQKKMVYIANSPFPSNTAYATRIFYMCKIYESMGYQITIISTEGINESIEWLDVSNMKTKTYFPGINGWKMNLNNLVFGGTKLKKVLQTLTDENPDIVIVGGGYTRLFKPVKDFCDKTSAKFIIEVCEWFTARQFPLGRLGPFYWDNRIALRYLYKKADAIVVISSYLEDYYSKFGVNTVRIPTILDSKYKIKSIERECESDKINIVYSGFPGKKKDILDVIILALLKEPELQKKINLNIIGPSEEYLKRQSRIDDESFNKLRSCITLYGPLSREISLQHVAKADYTILIRENTLNSKAGFPTKVAESMLQGTPVIANLTSDIGLYLRDMETGVVLDGPTVADVINGLSRVIQLSSLTYQNMRRNCQSVAAKDFDYRSYVEDIIKLHEIIS